MTCWICHNPINKALSLPTIDQSKRVCLACDRKIQRRPASAIPRPLFAEFNRDWEEAKSLTQAQ